MDQQRKNPDKDKTAKEGKTYYYKVKPIEYNTVTGKTVAGGFSEPEGFKIVLNYIGQLKATATSATKVKLTWEKAKGASEYEVIYKSNLVGDAYKVAGTTKKTSFTKFVSKDTGYTFVVRAYKVENGVRTCYQSSTISVATGLTSPKNLIISSQSTSGTAAKFTTTTNIKWDKVYGATGYKIYGYKSGVGEVLLATTKKSNYKLSQTITPTSTAYYSSIYVDAYKGDVTYRSYISGYSALTGKKDGEYVYKYYAISPKLEQTTVSVKKKSATSATVSWKAVAGATSYTVVRRSGSNYSYSETLTGTSYVDENITAGTTYTYYVTAYTSLANISSVNSENVKYTAAVPTPSVKVANKSSKKATLTITDSAKVAKSFEIYRATSKKGTYKKIKTVKASTTGTTTYTDSKLTKNKTYYYKVVAVIKNTTGASVSSAKSSAKSIKIKK